MSERLIRHNGQRTQEKETRKVLSVRNLRYEDRTSQWDGGTPVQTLDMKESTAEGRIQKES